ncbi:MAG: type II toxin-antitoxin system VapC family toxin [bacterium]|nr:type II toxin-antitoxin system VapC family toxin [bacterium]
MSGRAAIDATVAIKAVLPDPLQEACRDLLERLISEGTELVAPALWAYETTSTLAKAVHFKHLTADEGRRALDRIQALHVHLEPPDPDQNLRALEWTLALKRAAAYDSYYLALAEIEQCDLWTADKRLFNSVGESWVRSVQAETGAEKTD